ncbi:uncharacterized protein [Littorina saxatilis]|uniref:poly(ADP-ribose) glycohydrolase n=1 Tax=Littorina saxatilis TaxID=31220 RepID=A0AAN9ANG0_9CAEN
MGPEQVPFPHDSPNWALVRDLLSELQERLLNETINAQDAAMHVQVVYEACQATQQLDERWIQRQHDTSSFSRQGAIPKLDPSYVWFGMLKFLSMKAGREEAEKFLFTTLPNIIELALRIEEYMPPGRLSYSRQQKGGSTVLSRQFITSILACSFLCLFPERLRDRASKLNVINFTNFFKLLPQSLQVAKLRCILHYFERTMEAGLERHGSITFHRQVADRSVLPTLEDMNKSETELCSVLVHPTGAIEDVGASALQVDFASRSIGGGVLGRGGVQEEIRFSTCPELIASLLFMESMEDNEAIVITGFEQFSFCTGYSASLEFAGPFFDRTERDTSGNLLNTLCAIDAMSFRCGGRQLQYFEGSLLREINKALVGFSRVERRPVVKLPSGAQGPAAGWEEQFAMESENHEGEVSAVMAAAAVQMAEVMSRTLLSQGMVEGVRALMHDRGSRGVEDVESLALDEQSLLSVSPDVTGGQSSSTPRDDAQVPQVPREGAGHGSGGNGERVSLPLAVPRPQNGSCDLLEVDYSEWLANFRRRSSQLSDLASRRSSSSTKHSSEFSSDLEEIYETLVQVEKTQHGIIEEENYGAALSEYAAHFVSSLMEEGTFTAAQMLPGMKEFQQGGPPAGTLRPQVMRPTAVRFGGKNGSSDLVSVTEYHSHETETDDEVEQSSQPENGEGEASSRKSRVEVPPHVLSYVNSLVNSGFQSAMAEAVTVSKKSGSEDDIPDDVYVWFADKIVHEVLAHVADELYFQRFASDSRWRAALPVNREGVQQRYDPSDSDSASSADSSGSEACRDSADFQTASVNQPGGVKSDFGYSEVSCGTQTSRKESSDAQRSSTVGAESCDIQSKTTNGATPQSQSAQPADQRTTKRKLFASRTLSQSLDSETAEVKERREEKKSVTFIVDLERRRSGAISDPAMEIARASIPPIMQDLPPGVKSPRSTVSHLFVVKDVPVPCRVLRSPVVKEVTSPRTKKEAISSRSTNEVSSSRSSGAQSDLAWKDDSSSAVRPGIKRITTGKDANTPKSSSQSSSSSSSFFAKATSSIPKTLPMKTETSSLPSPSPVCQPPIPVFKPPSQAMSSVCDIPNQAADSSGSMATSTAPLRDPPPGAVRFSSSLQRQLSLLGEENISSVPSSFRAVKPSGDAGDSSAAAADPEENALSDIRTVSEQGAAASLSAHNLDCYRAAAAIVSQVLKSLPEHLSPAELQQLRGSPTSFYYHGRKYESIVPRGSYETAAAVIGASERENVVSESYVQNRVVATAPSSDPTSPRRTRSQSPCFSWLSKRLSRETLTNAFVKVESSRQNVKSYERRSSEPCQRSVNLSLQEFNISRFGYGMDNASRNRNNAQSDDDMQSMKVDSWRRSSLDSISLSRRRSSCGFKDPVLSRFAQELMMADTSVPQLFLVGSASTASTSGSRRSSLSGFRDSTLAVFENKLLNSSFSSSQAPSSPKHKRPKRSLSKESRMWKSDSSEPEYWFPIPRRVGHEFQEQMERVNRVYSVDEVEDFADFIATTILQQAVGILYHDLEMTQQGRDIVFFSENLADRLIHEAMSDAAKLMTTPTTTTTTTATATTTSGFLSVRPGSRLRGKQRGKPKSVSDSEWDFSVSSNDLTARSLEDRLTDFQEGAEGSVETYASSVADLVLAGVWEELGAKQHRLVPGCRAIATGNWGCGAYGGDPCLKMALQWVAASLARSPKVLFFTYGDPRMQQLRVVVDKLSRHRWTVGQLVSAVRAYCIIVQDDVQVWAEAWSSGTGTGNTVPYAQGGRGGTEGFVPSISLLDFLLMQL